VSIEKFEVKGLGTIGVTDELPYNEGICVLREEGFDAISLRDLAFGRLYAGKSTRDFLRKNGTRTKEAVLYSGRDLLFLFDSPLLRQNEGLDAAVSATRLGQEIYFTDDFFEETKKTAKKDSHRLYKNRIVVFPNRRELRYQDKTGNMILPCFRIHEFTIPNWAFKDVAEDYAQLMLKEGINNLPIWIPDKDYLSTTHQPFLRQIWICCFGKTNNKEGVAGISGNNRKLYEKDRLIGLRKE